MATKCDIFRMGRTCEKYHNRRERNMSLILVERKSGTAGDYYVLTNMESQEKRRWTPPTDYSTNEIQSVLKILGDQLENTAAYSSMLESPYPTRPILSPDMLFSDFINNVFMERKARVISENTRSSWQGIFKAHILPHLGHYSITEINALHLDSYMMYLQQLGLKKSTINKHYTILKSVFKMLYMMNAIDVSPLSRVERPRTYKSQLTELITPESGAFSQAEIFYIFECMKNEPFMHQVLFRIMCETGIRRGECCALTWDNIDFEKRTITIVGNLCYTPEKGVYMDTPKNGKKNVVFISEKSVEMLRELQVYNICFHDSKYVFSGKDKGQPIHPHMPTKYFARISKRYGINHLHPHKLRHTFASIALSNGANAVAVAKLLGHSSVEVLLRYYVSPDYSQAKAASQILHNAISEK